MIKMKNGTKVYFKGEWDEESKRKAIYEARKLGGTPAGKVVGSALIVWEQRPLKFQRDDLIKTVMRITQGFRAAIVEAHEAKNPRRWPIRP